MKHRKIPSTCGDASTFYMADMTSIFFGHTNWQPVLETKICPALTQSNGRSEIALQSESMPESHETCLLPAMPRLKTSLCSSYKPRMQSKSNCLVSTRPSTKMQKHRCPAQMKRGSENMDPIDVQNPPLRYACCDCEICVLASVLGLKLCCLRRIWSPECQKPSWR